MRFQALDRMNLFREKAKNGMLRERYGLDASQEQVVYQTDGGMGVI